MENGIKAQLNELMMRNFERCSTITNILQRIEDIEWESQYDSESDYIDDVRNYQIELSMLEGFVEELKIIINKNTPTEEQQFPIGMKQSSSKEALNHLFNKNK
jgi:hypothetical protein